MSNSIFNSGKNPNSEVSDKLDIHSKTLITIIQRQKDIESSLENIHDKMDMVDHNSVKDFKKVFSEIKHLKDDILDLKSEIKKIRETQMKISKQLKLVSTKDEVKKLEKYIDLWEPMNFITREEAKEMHKKSIDKLTKIIEEFLEGK